MKLITALIARKTWARSFLDCVWKKRPTVFCT